MAVDVDGITPGLGSSVEQVALLFDATDSSQMTIWTTHNVVKDNVIQLSCIPLVPLSCQVSAELRKDLRQSTRPVLLAATSTLDGLYETRTLSIQALDPRLRRVQYHRCLQAAPPNLDLV
jgi:hypothetical protein